MKNKQMALLALILLGAFNSQFSTVQAQNLFVSDAALIDGINRTGGYIYEFTNTVATGQGTFASGLYNPGGIAFNSAGNLFVSDASGNINEFTPGGTRTTFASGLIYPVRLAFNSAGNLFVADVGAGAIFEFAPGGARTTFATGLDPYELAFNSAGDLFEADPSSGNIYEFTPDGARTTFASGLFEPIGLTFSSTGILFVTDYGSGNIYEFTPGGTRTTFASGLILPEGLAFTSAGDLFVVQGLNSTRNVVKFTSGGVESIFTTVVVNPACVAFQPLTPVFSGLTASQSIGNGTSAITLAGKVSGTSPTTYPAAGEPITVIINGNAQTTTINDAIGDFSLNFNPSAIPPSATPYTISYSYAGDLLLFSTTNTSTMLKVNQATPTITTAPTATPITYGQVLSASTLSGGVASVPGTFAFTTPSLTPNAGTAAQSVTFTPSNTTDYASVLITVSVTVNQATPIITWTNPAAITYGTALNSNQLNATANMPGSFAYNPANGTVLNAGLHTLSVIFSPSNTSQYFNATDTVSLIVSLAPLTVTANNTNRVFGQTNPVFTGTITGLVNGDNITATYNSGATISSPAGSYPIIPGLVDPNNRQTNYTISLVNGTLTIFPLNYNYLVLNSSNLLGYWPFTVASQANSVVNGYTGTFVSDAVVSLPGVGPQLVLSPSNTAVVLNGNGSFVNTSLVGGLTNNQGSIIGWFNLSMLPSTAGRIFTIASESQNQNDFDLQIAINNQINFYTDSGSSTIDLHALTANDLGVWHFIAATFTASVSRNIYLDGVLVVSSQPGMHNPAGTGTFAMGASDVFKGRFFQGALADVAVYNRQLPSIEVSNLYAAAVSISAAPPVIQIAPQSGGSFTFFWNTITNRSYQIQASTNLAYGNWTSLGGTVTATYSTATNSQAISTNSQQFYRVVLLP